jgi:hypothetical protein
LTPDYRGSSLPFQQFPLIISPSKRIVRSSCPCFHADMDSRSSSATPGLDVAFRCFLLVSHRLASLPEQPPSLNFLNLNACCLSTASSCPTSRRDTRSSWSHAFMPMSNFATYLDNTGELDGGLRSRFLHHQHWALSLQDGHSLTYHFGDCGCREVWIEAGC